MKKLVLLILLLIAACGTQRYAAGNDINDTAQPVLAELHEPLPPSDGQIHLFGERHSDAEHVTIQFEYWYYFYHEHGMRHLFVELPFFTAELLNIWMQENDDEILELIFFHTAGTAFSSNENWAFLLGIKYGMPETVFHGTDVGHQYGTIGQLFLNRLRAAGQAGSKVYLLTLNNIEQGRMHYGPNQQNHSLRADMMVENFIRAFDALAGENIMSAFYGAAHVALGYYSPDLGSGPTLAEQLTRRYGDQVHRTDLLDYVLDWRLNNAIANAVFEQIQIGDNIYSALFVGEEYLYMWLPQFLKREFYRIEEENEAFWKYPATGNVLPFDNFPVRVEVGHVFAVRYTYADGSTRMEFLRAAGTVWQGREATEEFLPE